ncbi:MAG: hypothetical protein QOK43_2904 [Acidimicrobiaceae bacterium]|nr:hypothetical protein [Acidimicrobiaceae bacterium]
MALPLALSLPVLGAATEGLVARADTTCADVAITRASTTPVYVLGPNNCVETGYDRTDHVHNDHSDAGMDPGEPNGWWIDVWLTLPPPLG